MKFRITDNNGAVVFKGSKKACDSAAKKILSQQEDRLSLQKFDGHDWFGIGKYWNNGPLPTSEFIRA